MADTIELGDVSVTRVLEWRGAIRTGRDVFPSCPPGLWERNASLLVPDFWSPADDAYLCDIQSWVLRSGGRTIVVDTGSATTGTGPRSRSSTTSAPTSSPT